MQDRHLLNKALTPLHANILRMKGEALLSLLEFKEAETFFKGLLDTYKHAWVYIGYVKSLLKQGRIDEIHDMLITLSKKPEKVKGSLWSTSIMTSMRPGEPVTILMQSVPRNPTTQQLATI